jgi:hypothetical protein
MKSVTVPLSHAFGIWYPFSTKMHLRPTPHPSPSNATPQGDTHPPMGQGSRPRPKPLGCWAGFAAFQTLLKADTIFEKSAKLHTDMCFQHVQALYVPNCSVCGGKQVTTARVESKTHYMMPSIHIYPFGGGQRIINVVQRVFI